MKKVAASAIKRASDYLFLCSMFLLCACVCVLVWYVAPNYQTVPQSQVSNSVLWSGIVPFVDIDERQPAETRKIYRTGREGRHVFHSLGFDFELLLLDAFFTRVKHGVLEEDEVPLISVHIWLWCYDVTMLMFCGCFFVLKGMLIPTRVQDTYTHTHMLCTLTQTIMVRSSFGLVC